MKKTVATAERPRPEHVEDQGGDEPLRKVESFFGIAVKGAYLAHFGQDSRFLELCR